MKRGNELIAEYDGYKVKWESNTTTWNTGKTSWPLYAKDGKTTDAVFYSTSMDWLYPVYIKLRKELIEIQDDNLDGGAFANWLNASAGDRKKAIESTLISGSIADLHAEIVKGITFLNEQKK